MGIAPHGSGVAAHPYDIAPYLQPFTLETPTLRSISVAATRGGQTIAASTVRAGETDSVLVVPGSGTVTDASPARVVFGTAREIANADARPAVSGTGFD